MFARRGPTSKVQCSIGSAAGLASSRALSGRTPLFRKPTDFGVRSAPAESAIDEDDSALSPTACFEGICFGEALKVESMPSMCGTTGGVREIELAAHTKSKKTVEL